MKILNQALDIFKKEPNLVKVPEPVVVVGDIHGQYCDYVDRGIFGLECVMLLLAIKINFPKKFILLRGNHESRNMTESFTFRNEII